MADSVLDSLDESFDDLETRTEQTVNNLKYVDNKFFERHKSNIEEIDNKTRDVNKTVIRWKMICTINLFIELLMSVSLLFIAININ